MKTPMRWLVLLLALALPAFLVAGSAYGGPKLKFPSREKKPQPKVEDAALGPGFQEARDAPSMYRVDPASARNEVVFISKAPKETINGKASKVEGSISLNPRRFDEVAGSFTVAWKDIDTGNPQRNGHMMAAPWVDAASHPNIVLTISKIELSKKKSKSKSSLRARIIGEMSMNGKAKAMKIPATLVYVTPGVDDKGQEKKEGLGIKAAFRVALKDFDIKGKGVGQAVASTQKVKVSLFLEYGADKTPEEKKETVSTAGA